MKDQKKTMKKHLVDDISLFKLTDTMNRCVKKESNMNWTDTLGKHYYSVFT